MKKKENISDELQKYSRFSVAFLFLNGTLHSQVVYTDIEPDVVLENEMDTYVLDLNDDSANDFRFQNRSYNHGGYWTSGSIYYIPFKHIERINGTALFDNSFAANTEDFGTTFSELIRALPFALEEGAVISESLSFQPNYHQPLALKTEFDLAGELYYYGGHWYPEITDGFVGVKFEDNDSNFHYGWIRCDVLESGRILVIKDFAYETQENYPILAGDTLSYVDVENFQNTLNATVYNFNKQLYIHMTVIADVKLSIWDVSGKEILNQTIESNFEIIPLNNLASGLYVIELRNGLNAFRQKVFI